MSAVFDAFRLGAVALEVLASGHDAPAALARRQQSRLADLLAGAARNSRFYQTHLNGIIVNKHNALALLEALPAVGKNELMARFDDWVTDPRLKLAQLQAFTADPKRIGESYLNQYLIWESSGTSNSSGVFVQDARAMAVYDALEALRRSQTVQNWLNPCWLGQRIAFVGVTTGHFASIISMQRLRQLNPFMMQRLRCFSILQSSQALLEQLNDFAPTIIATYPTVASLLAHAASHGRLQFRPQEIWTGGETLSAAVRRHIALTLSCRVRNSYGASEFMSIGWECSHAQMHANIDWVILEPVDELGRRVPLGQPSYSTWLTNLANHVQPLIRYDLGDQITVQAQRCACGSPLPVIEVQGRRDDALQMAGCHGQLVTLLPLALTTVLEDDAGVFDFQLCQRDAHTLLLTLDASEAEPARAVQRCQAALQHLAQVQGLAPIEVIVEFGKAIPRGRSGKAQRVVAGSLAKDASTG